MLWADAVRGYDSTGIVFGTEKELQHYKRGLTSPDFLRTYGWERLVKPQLEKSKIIIGHNRAATKGSVSDQNAHPFFSNDGKISLVHNGYISNANNLLPNGVWTQVDSAAVPLLIEERGEKDTLEAIRGGFSLVWHNQNDGTLNIARNKEREMYVGYVKDRRILVYGSEYLMLHWILARHGIRIEKWDEIPIGVHHKFDVKNPREVTRTPFQLPPNTSTTYTRGVNNTSGTTDAGATCGTNYRQQQDVVVKGFLKRIEDLDGAQMRRAGIPTSRKKLVNIACKLDRLGIKLGDSFTVKLQDYSVYRNQRDRGAAFGIRRFNGDISVEFPGLTQAEYTKYKAMDSFYGMVVGEKSSRDKTVLVCIPNLYLTAVGKDDVTKIEEIDATSRSIKLSNGSYVQADELKGILLKGCGWCAGDLLIENMKDFIWFDDRTCLCDVCSEDDEVLESLSLKHPAA